MPIEYGEPQFFALIENYLKDQNKLYFPFFIW